jgi:hypothetical protein
VCLRSIICGDENTANIERYTRCSRGDSDSRSKHPTDVRADEKKIHSSTRNRVARSIQGTHSRAAGSRQQAWPRHMAFASHARHVPHHCCEKQAMFAQRASIRLLRAPSSPRRGHDAQHQARRVWRWGEPLRAWHEELRKSLLLDDIEHHPGPATVQPTVWLTRATEQELPACSPRPSRRASHLSERTR